MVRDSIYVFLVFCVKVEGSYVSNRLLHLFFILFHVVGHESLYLTLMLLTIL